MCPAGHHHSTQITGGEERLPLLFDAAVHPDRGLQERSCAACSAAHPLSSQCCGMCHFRLNQEAAGSPQLCSMHHVRALRLSSAVLSHVRLACAGNP